MHCKSLRVGVQGAMLAIAGVAMAATGCLPGSVDSLIDLSAPLYEDPSGNACEPDFATLTMLGGQYSFPGCIKLEGGDIGADFTGSIGEVTFTITDWVPKEGSGGEYIGFTVISSAPVSYVVKAATALFVDDTTTWVHPAGTSGAEAHGISFVAICLDAPEVDDTPRPENPERECDANECCRTTPKRPDVLPPDPNCSHLDDACGYGAIEPDTGECVYQESGACDPSNGNDSNPDGGTDGGTNGGNGPSGSDGTNNDGGTPDQGSDPNAPDCSHLDDACGYGAVEPDTGVCQYHASGACDEVR